KISADRLERSAPAWIVGGNQVDLAHQQHARVERIAAERGRERLALVAPATLENGRAQAVAALRPGVSPRGEAEVGGNFRQAVAGSPAHDGRRGVHFEPRAQLPD